MGNFACGLELLFFRGLNWLENSGDCVVNVVVVSNRVARANDGEPIAGGLAAALLPAVKNYGAIWVGSSGRLRDLTEKDAFAEVEALGKGALATVDFPKVHYCGYYEG